MQNRAIETFYLFFQGLLLFQAIFLAMLYFVTRRADIRNYFIFLLLSSAYFFLNAPDTFFGIPDNDIFNSKLYLYGNIPLIIIANLFYTLFLKAFFSDIFYNKMLDKIVRAGIFLTYLLLAAFFLLRYFGVSTQPVFYVSNLLAGGISIYIIVIVLKQKLDNTRWVCWGMAFNILGTLATVIMIVLERYGIRNIITVGYPLIFMRIGLLADIFFYQIAILKKWHVQEQQLSIEKLRSQIEVEKLRNKISGELHDDIGSTLSGISMYSHLIHTHIQSGKYDDAKQSAGIIQKSANDAAHNLSDMVWSVNPDSDTLIKLTERLQEYATNMAVVKNIQVLVNVSENLNEQNLPMESRRNIYLIFKEAINNAVKYSHATLIELDAKQNEGSIEISLKENGEGFDINTVKRGNGLNNMQKRADEIGAFFSMRSSIGNGCIISLNLKNYT